MITRFVLAALVAVLAGCGGGGDAQVPPDEPAVVPSEQPPPRTGCNADPRPVQCL